MCFRRPWKNSSQIFYAMKYKIVELWVQQFAWLAGTRTIATDAVLTCLRSSTAGVPASVATAATNVTLAKDSFFERSVCSSFLFWGPQILFRLNVLSISLSVAVVLYSSLDRRFICSAQIANPTCRQSSVLHSLQKGTPSAILTTTSFSSMLSCSRTILSWWNTFKVRGTVDEFLFSPSFSQSPNAIIPSSALLLRAIKALLDFNNARCLEVPMIDIPATSPDDVARGRMLNMVWDYPNL